MNSLIVIFFIAGGALGVLAKLVADRLLRRKFSPFCALPYSAVCAILFALSAYLGAEPNIYPLIFILIAVCSADIDECIIPDKLIAAGIVIGLVRMIANGAYTHALTGAAVGALPLILIDRFSLIMFKKDGLGYGDVKLMLMCGLFLNGWLSVLALVAAFISGGVVMAVMLIAGKIKRGDYIAFGPFLAAGVMFAALFGEQIVSWYADVLFYGL